LVINKIVADIDFKSYIMKKKIKSICTASYRQICSKMKISYCVSYSIIWNHLHTFTQRTSG